MPSLHWRFLPARCASQSPRGSVQPNQSPRRWDGFQEGRRSWASTNGWSHCVLPSERTGPSVARGTFRPRAIRFQDKCINPDGPRVSEGLFTDPRRRSESDPRSSHVWSSREMWWTIIQVYADAKANCMLQSVKWTEQDVFRHGHAPLTRSVARHLWSWRLAGQRLWRAFGRRLQWTNHHGLCTRHLRILLLPPG